MVGVSAGCTSGDDDDVTATPTVEPSASASASASPSPTAAPEPVEVEIPDPESEDAIVVSVPVGTADARTVFSEYVVESADIVTEGDIVTVALGLCADPGAQDPGCLDSVPDWSGLRDGDTAVVEDSRDPLGWLIVTYEGDDPVSITGPQEPCELPDGGVQGERVGQGENRYTCQ